MMPFHALKTPDVSTETTPTSPVADTPVTETEMFCLTTT
jgi:hypothetical protein